MQTAVTSQTASRAAFAAPAEIAAASSSGVSLWLRRYAWLVVGWNIAVILWGAVVRATGSGAGCGNHWPLCNGQVFPASPQITTMIEFTHRAMTGGATFTILGLLVWTFRATRARHLARFFAIASTLLLLNEAFLGALLVKLGYVVHDQSPGRFIVLPIHLANTLLLLAALALTAHFLARESGFMNGSVPLCWALLDRAGLDNCCGSHGFAGGLGRHLVSGGDVSPGLRARPGAVESLGAEAAVDASGGECAGGAVCGWDDLGEQCRRGCREPEADQMGDRAVGLAAGVGNLRCAVTRPGLDADPASAGSGRLLGGVGGVGRTDGNRPAGVPGRLLQVRFPGLK